MKNKIKNKELQKLKPKIVKILKENNVTKAGVFGSYARGEQTKKSDIDILVEFDGSLLDLVSLEMELERVVKKKVDLLTYGGINHLLKDDILGEEIRIL